MGYGPPTSESAFSESGASPQRVDRLGNPAPVDPLRYARSRGTRGFASGVEECFEERVLSLGGKSSVTRGERFP